MAALAISRKTTLKCRSKDDDDAGSNGKPETDGAAINTLRELANVHKPDLCASS